VSTPYDVLSVQPQLAVSPTVVFWRPIHESVPPVSVTMSDASSSEWMLARWPPILTQYASASAKFLLSLKNWNVGSGSFGGGGGGEGHGCCGGSGGGGGETLGSRTIAALQPEVLPQRCIHSCSPETRVGLPMGSSHVAAVQMRLKVDRSSIT